MLALIALLLTLLLPVEAVRGARPDGLCDGNRFVYLSTHVLGMQTALKQTFDDLSKTIKIDEVIYQD